MEPVSDSHREFFEAWDTPLAPWGGFRVPAGLSILDDSGRKVLAFLDQSQSSGAERLIVARVRDIRNCRIAAMARLVDVSAPPNADCSWNRDALAGIVFRAQTSRAYYQFGIEGKRRAVLYRRDDDKWDVLAEQDIAVEDDYVDLEVALDGADICCRSEALGVDIFRTDRTWRTGMAGFRSLGASNLASLDILQTPDEQAIDRRQAATVGFDASSRGKPIPDPVPAKTFDLAKLGGTPNFIDLVEPGRYDMLVVGESGLRAMAVGGEVLWELPERVGKMVFSRDCGADGRLIYGCTGVRSARPTVSVRGESSSYVVHDEMLVIRGKDGVIVAREPLPPMAETQRFFDFSPTSMAFTGPECTDIVLREWVDALGGGGVRLWALSRDLEVVWDHVQPGAYYGHHMALASFDIDGDGRDELLAGGTMYDADGKVLWVHDRSDEVAGTHSADHYDAVALGMLSGDPKRDPVAMLLAGSAGVYTVDALSGRTRSCHKVGHAQGRFVGKMRNDIPGEQILVATRWGNFGILTLFSGKGERLWTIQPDNVGQGSRPVTWPGSDTQLIWANTTGPVQAFYDGHGRSVKQLPELARLWGDRAVREVSAVPIRMGADGIEYLSLTVDGTLHAFAPES
jgi:hypothetical protein